VLFAIFGDRGPPLSPSASSSLPPLGSPPPDEPAKIATTQLLFNRQSGLAERPSV
jgi:hypothetical protein